MIDIDALKEKIELFTAEEREVLRIIRPIHFKKNLSDQDILDYLDNIYDDELSGREISLCLNLLFQNKVASKIVQEAIIENFDIGDLDIKFDIDVLKKGVSDCHIFYSDIPNEYKTSEFIIDVFGTGSSDDSPFLYQVREFKKQITNEFVRTHYDNPKITNSDFAKLMAKRTKSKRIKTYLTLKFGSLKNG